MSPSPGPAQGGAGPAETCDVLSQQPRLWSPRWLQPARGSAGAHCPLRHPDSGQRAAPALRPAPDPAAPPAHAHTAPPAGDTAGLPGNLQRPSPHTDLSRASRTGLGSTVPRAAETRLRPPGRPLPTPARSRTRACQKKPGGREGAAGGESTTQGQEDRGRAAGGWAAKQKM